MVPPVFTVPTSGQGAQGRSQSCAHPGTPAITLASICLLDKFVPHDSQRAATI